VMNEIGGFRTATRIRSEISHRAVVRFAR
jgi:hypothetical protein